MSLDYRGTVGVGRPPAPHPRPPPAIYHVPRLGSYLSMVSSDPLQEFVGSGSGASKGTDRGPFGFCTTDRPDPKQKRWPRTRRGRRDVPVRDRLKGKVL